MKLYQVNYDTVLITLFAYDEDDMLDLLNEEIDKDAFYFNENNVLFYTGFDLDEDYECNYREVEVERSVLQFESH